MARPKEEDDLALPDRQIIAIRTSDVLSNESAAVVVSHKFASTHPSVEVNRLVVIEDEEHTILVRHLEVAQSPERGIHPMEENVYQEGNPGFVIFHIFDKTTQRVVTVVIMPPWWEEDTAVGDQLRISIQSMYTYLDPQDSNPVGYELFIRQAFPLIQPPPDGQYDVPAEQSLHVIAQTLRSGVVNATETMRIAEVFHGVLIGTQIIPKKDADTLPELDRFYISQIAIQHANANIDRLLQAFNEPQEAIFA